jgi:hypothetical protein
MNRGSARGKVNLFYPPYAGWPLGAPLTLISLAGLLPEAGRQFRVFAGSSASPCDDAFAGTDISFAWELGLSSTAERLVTHRSLLTGRTLTEREQEVC